jgi:hypothetical protein
MVGFWLFGRLNCILCSVFGWSWNDKSSRPRLEWMWWRAVGLEKWNECWKWRWRYKLLHEWAVRYGTYEDMDICSRMVVNVEDHPFCILTISQDTKRRVIVWIEVGGGSKRSEIYLALGRLWLWRMVVYRMRMHWVSEGCKSWTLPATSLHGTQQIF